jgi:hypothetical protein
MASPLGFDPVLGVLVTSGIDYPHPDREGNHISMLAFGILEWTFLAALVILVGAAGLFALFIVAQLFRNPRRS